jgi:iron complex outermembrane receptor protein
LSEKWEDLRINTINWTLTGFAAFAAASAWASPAPDAAGSGTQADANALEEVVVTARRREESIQTVPISITVVSQDALRSNAVQGVVDLQYLVPALSASGFYRDNPNITIRGQGTNGSGLPGVIEYFNEVPLPVDRFGAGGGAGGPGLYFDLENVQALEGPQGTLFGRNSTGGALLIQSKRPTNEFGGYVQITDGNYSDHEIDAALNVPIIADTLLMRIAINGQTRDGYTWIQSEPNYPHGTDLDNTDYFAGRVTVTYRPSDSFQNEFIYSGLSSRNHGQSGILTLVDPNGAAALAYPGILQVLAQQQSLGIRTQVASDVDIENQRKYKFFSDTARFSLTPNITLRTILGYTQIRRDVGIDADGTIYPIVDYSSYVQGPDNNIQYTAEAQLLGKSLSDRLDWVAGVFYLDLPAQSYATYPQNIFGETTQFASRQADASKAAYAQGTYDLSSVVQGLKFTGGLRYTWDDRAAQSQILDGNGVCTVAFQNANGQCTSNGRTAQGAPTWTLGLDEQITPSTLVYLASRRGYRTGGYNSYALNSSHPEFQPEYVVDEELGIKSDWEIGSVPVRTNADVYHQGYTNIQLSTTNYQNGLVNVFVENAASATVWGAEFQTSANITKALQLGASLEYINKAYTSFAPGVDIVSVLGMRTENAPRFKYGLDTRYALPVNSNLGDASVSANWSWQSANGDTSQPGGLTPAYGLLNLNANWDHINGSLVDASFFMTNAMNKVYTFSPQSLYVSTGYAIVIPGQPRMYGFRVRYRFGGKQ